MSRIIEYASHGNVDPRLSSATVELSRRVDLHNTQGSSDKVYIMYLFYDKASGTWGMNGYHGRRGASLIPNIKSFISERDADKELLKVMRAKMNGNYQLINDEKFAKAYSSSPSQSPLSKNSEDMMPMSMPEFEMILFHDMRQSMTVPHANLFAIERLDNLHLYMATLKMGDWHIWKGATGKFEGKLPILDAKYKPSSPQNNALLIGYMDTQNHLAVVDITRDGTQDYSRHQWKQRRAMMTFLFNELYPGQDPYDKTRPIYLNDYAFENKLDFMDQAPKGIFVTRHIDAPRQSKWVVATR